MIWYPAVPGTGTLERNINVLRDAAVLERRLPLVMFSHGACAFPEQSPFLRYVRGRNLFPRALRSGEAPDGVVVLEAHARGERGRR